jgi:hypothetical protein
VLEPVRIPPNERDQGPSTDAALTSGGHLAFRIAAALVAAPIDVVPLVVRDGPSRLAATGSSIAGAMTENRANCLLRGNP